MRLKDKVAIITGGSSGIGRAITLGYVKEGAKVVIAALHEDPCRETVREVEDLGGQAVYFTLDVSDLGKHRELLDTAVNTFGKADILVNDAGYARREGGIRRDARGLGQDDGYKFEERLFSLSELREAGHQAGDPRKDN